MLQTICHVTSYYYIKLLPKAFFGVFHSEYSICRIDEWHVHSRNHGLFILDLGLNTNTSPLFYSLSPRCQFIMVLFPKFHSVDNVPFTFLPFIIVELAVQRANNLSFTSYQKLQQS